MNRKRPLYITEQSRLAQLDAAVFQTFGAADSDALSIGHRVYETRLLEVIDVRPRGCLLMDVMQDLEFKPVVFPKAIAPLLRRHDVFLATIGQTASGWTVLCLNPRYETDSD